MRVHATGAEGSFIAELVERGVKVEEVSTADYARATGALLDAVTERQVRHLGQRVLDAAVERCDLKRTASGAATFVGRQGADVSTLKAVTVALGGVPAEREVKSDPFVVWA